MSRTPILALATQRQIFLENTVPAYNQISKVACGGRPTLGRDNLNIVWPY